MAKTVSTTHSSSDSWSKTHSVTQSKSESQSQSATKKVLDEALISQIMAGLTGGMTDEEISAYAESLLKPQLNAGLEAARQQHAAAELSGRQEIENLAAELAKGIEEQRGAYGKSMANVQTAALARGMGRSSYALETMANQGSALAKAIENLRSESSRKREQIEQRTALAARERAETEGRLNTDYAANLAAKVQELKNQQKEAYNRNYLSAVSGSMGTASTGSQTTTGTRVTDSETKGHSKGFSQTVTKRM